MQTTQDSKALHPSELTDHIMNRLRSGTVMWAATVIAILLAASSLMLPEKDNRQLHWARTLMLTCGLGCAIAGRFALENTIRTGRILLDYEDISAASRQQRLYEGMKPGAGIAEVTIEVERIDADAYLNRAAVDWRTHLGVLSPTDTGKSTLLLDLLSRKAKAKPTLVIAIEPKGASWPGLPDQNVVRVPFRPGFDDAARICQVLTRVLAEAQRYVDGHSKRDYSIVVVLEEWLSLYSTMKDSEGLDGLAKQFKSLITSFAAVGRGAACQLVLISQSPNVDDLGISGGVRRNFRLLSLGSRLGGFEALDSSLDNNTLVNRRYRERVQAEYETARAQLRGDRHPCIVSNLIGDMVCFPAPFMSEAEIDNLSVESLPAPSELIGNGGSDDDGNGRPGIGPTIYVAAEKAASLDEVEALILEVLADSSEPLKASHIKQKRAGLKSQDLNLIKRVLDGLAQAGQIQATEDETPRYFLP